MKKVVIVFLICITLIVFTYFLWGNPKVTNQISDFFTNAYENIVEGELKPYSDDVKINKLQPKKASHYYMTLNDSQKKIYTRIANSVTKLESKIKVKEYEFVNMEQVDKDVEKALYAFFADHPEVFYIQTDYSISTIEGVFGTDLEIQISYTVTDEAELTKQIAQIETVIDSIVQTAQGKSEFESELILHDSLAQMTEYFEYVNMSDIPKEAHTIYGAFLDKKAVCDGFAKSMQILLDKVGIESIIALGSLDKDPHAWNLVNIEKEWYNLDLTSNKSVKDKNKDLTIHSYFNIPTKDILETHIFDDQSILPEAKSTTNNYYIKQNKMIDAKDNFDAKLKQITNENSNNALLEFRVTAIVDVPEKTMKVLKDNNFSSYINNEMSRFTYYKVLDTYVVVKR